CGDRGNAEQPGRPPEQGQVTSWLSRRGQQQTLGGQRQRPETRQEGMLDTACKRYCRGQAEPSRQVAGRQPARQFQKGQRVAVRLGDKLISYLRIQSAVNGR